MPGAMRFGFGFYAVGSGVSTPIPLSGRGIRQWRRRGRLFGYVRLEVARPEQVERAVGEIPRRLVDAAGKPDPEYGRDRRRDCIEDLEDRFALLERVHARREVEQAPVDRVGSLRLDRRVR